MEEGSTPPGRGVLSMQDLSHGVIRVDSEEKLSVLTLQDVGSVMPGGETNGAGVNIDPDGVFEVQLEFLEQLFSSEDLTVWLTLGLTSD